MSQVWSRSDIAVRIDLANPGTLMLAKQLLRESVPIAPIESAPKFDKQPVILSSTASSSTWSKDTLRPSGKNFANDATKAEPYGVTFSPTASEGLMSDQVTREEIKARLETADVKVVAAEARVATVLETIRADNEKLRNQLGTMATDLQASSRVAQEQVNTFRAELAAHQAKAESAYLRAQMDIKSEVHGLRVWVLTGALTGALALIGFFAQSVIKGSADPGPATRPVATSSSQSASAHSVESRNAQNSDAQTHASASPTAPASISSRK